MDRSIISGIKYNSTFLITIIHDPSSRIFWIFSYLVMKFFLYFDDNQWQFENSFMAHFFSSWSHRKWNYTASGECLDWKLLSFIFRIHSRLRIIFRKLRHNISTSAEAPTARNACSIKADALACDRPTFVVSSYQDLTRPSVCFVWCREREIDTPSATQVQTKSSVYSNKKRWHRNWHQRITRLVTNLPGALTLLLQLSVSQRHTFEFIEIEKQLSFHFGSATNFFLWYKITRERR